MVIEVGQTAFTKSSLINKDKGLRALRPFFGPSEVKIWPMLRKTYGNLFELGLLY